ncbi:MAG TPA: aminotransferase class I/II-fold pyridoxal phosphate-dependent enzyme [Candidatus Limnocylindrales bacterium]|nr:aminotransferase class I/II-fold pyridoxal phosphate-dependent enzyme [Candidatus Limnocylindrales bacterium]
MPDAPRDPSTPAIPYGRQWVDEADIAAVAAVLSGDFLTTGGAVDEFERGLTAATGAAHAVALSSGTAALHAMYHAAGLGPGDEIVTSPLTFAGTTNAALYLGAAARFVDVSPDTGNIDPAAVAAAISPRTRFVVAIDFGGHPADYDELAKATAAAGPPVPILADGAHSLGATYRGRSVGTLAAATELSFHPVKLVTTGEGGAVLTDDEAIANRARVFRTHGIERTPERQREQGGWWMEQVALGFNYRLTDIQAALGTSQLRKMGAFLARRRAIAARYDVALADIEGLELPSPRSDVEPAWHLYPVRVREAARRRPFYDELRRLGLAVQVHYIPVYWHPYYAELKYKRGLCPIAEDIYSRSVSLPMFPKLTDADLERSIELVHRAAQATL